MNIDNIKHIIWDWNGTIIDDFSAALESINTMLGEHDLPVIDGMKYRDVFTFPIKDCYIELGFDLAKDSEWTRISQRFHDIYASNWHKVIVRKGMPELLIFLSDNGIRHHILSASEIGRLERQLKDLKIRDYFSSVYGLSDIYGSSKVDQGLRLLADLEIHPSEVIMIGDTIHDYEVASEMGIQCLLLSIGHQAEWRLKACACPRVDSIGSLQDMFIPPVTAEALKLEMAGPCVM